jgi:hypothetical protein
MKTKEELKTELHSLIDGIEDEELLSVLYEEILPTVIENHSRELSEEEENDAAEEEITGLDAALKDADRGEPLSLEEFKKMTKKWGRK